jgi:hypothetical protein
MTDKTISLTEKGIFLTDKTDSVTEKGTSATKPP